MKHNSIKLLKQLKALIKEPPLNDHLFVPLLEKLIDALELTTKQRNAYIRRYANSDINELGQRRDHRRIIKTESKLVDEILNFKKG